MFIGKLWLSAALAAVSAWGVKAVIHYANPIVAAVPILSVYGAVYFAITFALRIEECSALLARLGRADR